MPLSPRSLRRIAQALTCPVSVNHCQGAECPSRKLAGLWWRGGWSAIVLTEVGKPRQCDAVEADVDRLHRGQRRLRLRWTQLGQGEGPLGMDIAAGECGYTTGSLSSRKPTNFVCRKWFAPAHSRNSISATMRGFTQTHSFR
jgi:hypothetical protein